MKGGKDEKKMGGPMFPRLHVNDTEKGGPRAPPRNKMALYEQLSIPSQRFNSGSQQVHNSSSSVPSASLMLSQGAGHERILFSPYRMPPSTTHSADNSHSQSTEGLDLRSKMQSSGQKTMKIANYQTSASSIHFPLVAERSSLHTQDLANSKNLYASKLGNEEDFRVPTFLKENASCLKKDQHNMDKEKLTHLSPSHQGRSTTNPGESVPKVAQSTCSSSTHHQNAPDKHLKRTNTTDLRSRHHSRDHNEEHPLHSVTSKDCMGMTASRPFTREDVSEPLNDAYASPVQEETSPMDDLGGLHDTNARLCQENRTDFVLENNTDSDGEPIVPMEKGNVVWVRNKSSERASLANDHGSPNESCEDRAHRLLPAEDADRNDDASETSMVDSITVLDISPDDVVGVIGQKHFWKARRAIVNQQRLFAVQVFELHRLIKVQRLIAGSPHLLLDDTQFSKPSLKVSPSKKLPSDYGLKTSQQIVKQKTESQKPNQSTDCAAENPVRKPPPVSDGVNRGHVSHHSSYGAYTGNSTPASTPVIGDNKVSWYFQPPPGNQWLVPVMSPSEGLVYKPYTGPCPPTSGFMAPIYGGCRPMSGEFPSAAYGIPGPHPPGIGVIPGASPLAQTYFSPYGMPVMNPLVSSSAVEQVNPLTGVQSHGQAGEVNFNMHSQNSCNISNQKCEAMSHLFKFQASKEIERQGSTASSPNERAQGAGSCNLPEGRDALSLFPMAPAQPHQTGNSEQQHTRVIKVVPHNPRSATESAARIFQSIQEERQNYDSV